MRLAKSGVLAAFALLAFGAIGTAVASAEAPAILCLVAQCALTLEGSFSNKEKSTLETLGGLAITSTAASITLKCTKDEGVENKDCTLFENQTIDFTGMESKGSKCKSENSKNEAGDANGTVLALLDLHLANEEEKTTKTLRPLMLIRVLGVSAGEEELLIKCGIINTKLKGTLGCLLLPGLTNVAAEGKMEVVCKLNTTTHDPETGTCEQLCEFLTGHPFESKIGEKFEDAWLSIKLTGSFNKDIFIDD